ESHAAYIRWRQNRQYQLKHPFPPGVVISLSLAQLFVSPNFKLVSHMSRAVVRGIMSAFSGVLGKPDMQPPTVLPNQVVMAFLRSRFTNPDWTEYDNPSWSILYVVSQYVVSPDGRSDFYGILRELKTDSFANLTLGESDRSVNRDFLVYGIVEPIPRSIDVGPSATAGLSTLQQMFKLFWTEGSTTGDARGLERVPSQKMLSYRNMIAVIPATMKYLFWLGTTMGFVTITKRSDRTERIIAFTMKILETSSANFVIKQTMETTICHTQPLLVCSEKSLDLAVSSLMKDYDIHIDMGTDRAHKFPIYEHTWEGTTKHERYFIDRNVRLIPILRSRLRDFKNDQLSVFDRTTPWGKPWGYQRSFYLPAIHQPVGGLLIIPLPWLFFLYDPFNLDTNYIILSDYQFNHDRDPMAMTIYQLPGTGNILAFQPHECIFLSDRISPDELERLALLQRPDI
ncbi:MAG TPA: hypothetical protein VJ044_11460, partial [Candidatus Hodarchaeales archaeon]|nr:hypothetical protein [Candidatus Hodarchaeales archaeon]